MASSPPPLPARPMPVVPAYSLFLFAVSQLVTHSLDFFSATVAADSPIVKATYHRPIPLRLSLALLDRPSPAILSPFGNCNLLQFTVGVQPLMWPLSDSFVSFSGPPLSVNLIDAHAPLYFGWSPPLLGQGNLFSMDARPLA